MWHPLLVLVLLFEAVVSTELLKLGAGLPGCCGQLRLLRCPPKAGVAFLMCIALHLSPSALSGAYSLLCGSFPRLCFQVCSPCPKQLDVTGGTRCSPSCISCRVGSRSTGALPAGAALAQRRCPVPPSGTRCSFNLVFCSGVVFFSDQPPLGLPGGSLPLLCLDKAEFASLSTGESFLWPPVFFSFIHSLDFTEDDLLILIMPFTLLLWYVGFPSAALALSFQNLFVFLVSMPPARILLS